MRNLLRCFLVIVLTLCFNTIAVMGENTKDVNEQPVNAGRTISELLSGVVHLSDDDIRFRTKSGICVFVDPVNGPEDKLVIASGMVKPDLILITHSHSDHFQSPVIQQYLKLNPNVIVAGPADVIKKSQENGIGKVETVKPNQKYIIAGIDFNTVPSYFQNPQNGHPKANEWVGYVLQLDGARYYITGDTEPMPEMAGINPDVIFPLLWGCGGNLDNAVEMAKLSKARIVVPVHFHGGPGEPDAVQEETVKKYLARLPKGVTGVYYKNAKLISAP